MTNRNFEALDSPQDQPGQEHRMDPEPDYAPRYRGSGLCHALSYAPGASRQDRFGPAHLPVHPHLLERLDRSCRQQPHTILSLRFPNCEKRFCGTTAA